jgi:type IV pilus assembly protein PilY1
VDTDSDGKIDRLYVGDMGGRMWRFDIKDSNPNNWSAKILFTAPTGTKIFYPPDVTLEMGDFEMVFFGTGDREHPKEIIVVNRVYAVKDKNPATTLTESDLYDLTSDELQADGTTDTRKNEIFTDLNLNYDGWWIQLDTGEKSLAPIVVFDQQANFTTYTPVSVSSGDPCYVGEGVAKLYVVDYLTAVAEMDYDLTNNESGQTTLRKSDRSTQTGTGIPSGVVIAILHSGQVVAYIGVGGGIYFEQKGPIGGNSKKTYWKIVF